MLKRTFVLLATVCLTIGNLSAADSAFVGRWKINLQKSSTAGIQIKIEDLGNHQIKWAFGDDAEIITIDGQEHPAKHGGTAITTAEGPNHWKDVVKKDGKVFKVAGWTLSDDGQGLTFIYDYTRPDGSTDRTVSKNKRIAGTSGLAGTWEETEADPNWYPDMLIEPLAGDGLDFVTERNKEHAAVKFDGKDDANEGPLVAPGATTAGKRVDERTIELSDKLKGELVDTQRLELSADGKTLTDTITCPGLEKIQVLVYERP